MTPRLLKASSQKGAAMPRLRITTPASAGPRTRLILTPTLLVATAEESALAGTSSGTIACQAGLSMAPRDASRNKNQSSTVGVTSCSVTSAANNAETAVVRISSAKIRRRLSKISARAPAGSANRNSGRLFATWTSDTMSGSAFKLVMSHAAAALYIQEPMFETTVTIHRYLNTG